MAHSRNFNLFRIDPAQGAVQMAGDVARERGKAKASTCFCNKILLEPSPTYLFTYYMLLSDY